MVSIGKPVGRGTAIPSKLTAPWYLRYAPAHIALLMGVAGFVLAMLAAIWVGRSEYDRRLQDAEQSLATDTYFLSDHASRLFEGAQIALETAATMMRDWDWEEVERSERLHMELVSFVRALPYVRNIWLTDQAGLLRATSFVFPAPESNVDGTENFERLEQGEDLVIGQSNFGALTNESNFSIFRRMEAFDGTFRGMVSITAGLNYFDDYWRQVRKMEGTTIQLFRTDTPDGNPNPLVQFPPGEKFEPLTASAAASIAGSDAARVLATDEHFTAIQRVGNLPIVLQMSVPRERIIKGWWNWVSLYGPLVGLAMAALALLTALAARQARLDDAGRLALLEANRSLTNEIRGREQAEQQVRQMQKMQAVGQLTGGIAHDFNNLLTVILGNADLLVSEAADQPRLLHAAQLVVGAAERGAELTNRLLAYSRKQPLNPHTIDVNTLIQNIQNLLTKTIGAEVELDFVAGKGLWNAIADPVQLETAIINLAANARDAMPQGGRLTIETANAWLDDDYAAGVLDAAPGAYVLVAATDTGTGMNAETLRRAFEPFFTTKAAGKGSGLGLSMVYGFATQSNGHVRIFSEPGVGTTVRLYLPRSTDAAEALPVNVRRSTSLSGTERILLVEDDQDVLAFTSEALRQYGYDVVSAARASDALKLIDGGLQFDLLLTDVVLPDGTHGRQLADLAVAKRPGLKVLFASGYNEDAIVHDGRLAEGVSLISKPFRRLDLAAKVREVLDR